MRRTVVTRGGVDALEWLRLDWGMSTQAGCSFLEERTGQRFDPEALYCISYTGRGNARKWAPAKGLTIHVLSEPDARMWQGEAIAIAQ